MFHGKHTFSQKLSPKTKSRLKRPKWTLSMLLILLYLMVWFSFGICYWVIANSTNGEAFIFHSDQELESRIAMFKKNVGDSYVPHKELKDIILNKQYKQDISKILAGEKNNKKWMLVSDTPIGEYWSRYYREKLIKEGISFFSTDFNVDRSFCDSYYVKYYPVKITLYASKDLHNIFRGDIVQISSGKDLSKVIPVKQIHIIFENRFYADLIKSYDEDLKSIDIIGKGSKPPNDKSGNFEFVFENSIVFLDDSIITLQKVINGEYQFPLIDFLYYSAITITTTGYGDILPNSTSIRWLVMFETLIGVIIVGAFASSIFYPSSRRV